MNLTRFVRKNVSVILIGAIIGAIVGTYLAYKQTEGFQSPCDMSYCNDADYETVTIKSGEKRCLKKCHKINSKYIRAISDETICKEMSGTKVKKTVSRNYSSYSKLNINGNNSCKISVPATEITEHRNKCIKEYKGIAIGTEKCYVCPWYKTRPDKNSQGVYMC